MQVAMPAIFDRLNLPDPSALFDHTPPGVAGAVVCDALMTALRRVPEVAGQPWAMWRLQVLAQAGRVLIADPAHCAAAIHLTRTADPDLADSAPLAHVRLIALWKSHNRPGTVAEAQRVLALPSLAPKARGILRNSLRQWNIERELLPRIESLSEYWPNVEAAIGDPFSAPHDDGPFPLIDRIGATIARLHGRPPDDTDFIGRIRWGSQLHRRIFFARKLTSLVLQKSPQQRTGSEAALVALHQSIAEKISNPDMTAPLASIRAGRSAMILQAHAGLSTVHNLGLPYGEIPYSVVSVVAGRARRPQDFNLAAGRPDVAMEFAKLARLMKKTPRIVRIFPDGRHGETLLISVFGHPVQIGRGAATLAYLGKAATYFSGSHWTGQGFEFSMIPGPVASDYADKDLFEKDFGTFYAGCLEDIVMGAPEDMAPDGGFWPRMVK